ncbi:mucin-3A-like [Dromaius novaehollandiae]|uniref:mucin-3A-like n=1 Tax=Dromaius novaehollandiae TaxID=8790 RepID=UPI00311EE31A
MKLGCCCFLILLFVPAKAAAAACENGGTAVGEGCACPPGFNGTRCEIPAPSAACQNGGTAVGTKCYCPPGFRGALCQLPDEASACRNGATAFGTECVCPPGYRGLTCQDQEQPSPCLNGGTPLGTGCRCPPAFWGLRCECQHPESPVAPAAAGGRNVAGSRNVPTAVSNATLAPPPNTSQTNGTLPTTTAASRSPANATEHVTVSPGNVSASAVTAGPNRTSVAPTACSGNCTTPGDTRNGTAEPQHRPDDLLPSTTARPIPGPNTTEHVTVSPRNVSASAVTAGPNRTSVAPTASANTPTACSGNCTTRGDSRNGTAEPQHRPDDLLPSTTARPVPEPNATANVTVSPRNVSASAVTAGPNRTSVAPTASANTPTACSGNCTTRGDTRNGTAEPQHRPDDLRPSTTARPVPGPNATEHVTVSPRNVSASAVTAGPNRTSVAPTASANTPTACSGNCTTRGDTRNGTAEPQHRPDDLRPSTTARPVPSPNATANVTVSPRNVSASAVTAGPNRTSVAPTACSGNCTTPGDTRNGTAEPQHRPDDLLPSTTARPIPGPNTTEHVTVSPGNTSASAVTAGPNRTSVAPTACSGNCTTPGDTRNGTAEPQHRLDDLLPSTTARPVPGPNATANVTQAAPGGTAAGNGSVSVTATAAPNTTAVPVSLSNVTGRPLGSLCRYLPPWHLNGSSPTPVVCHNGGVANASECLCPPGFSGPSCETANDTDRCRNGSTAVGGRCICPPGLSGPRCDAPDTSTACQHGATAVGTECYCPSGYSGARCELRNASTAATPAARPGATGPKSSTQDPVSAGNGTAASGTTAEPTAQSTTAAKSTKATGTPPAPTTADPCQNGGSWTGTVCRCPPNLDGAHCQFAASTINITAELGPSVTMTARVTNRLFSEAMGNASSAAYRGFAEEFGRAMDRLYQNVSGYRGTRILSLTKGSVVVTYDVLLHPPAEAGPASGLHRASRELLETAKAAAQPQNCSRQAKELCFNTSSSEAAERNATELCRKYTPANFSRFYSPYRTRYSLLCVTSCTLNVPGAIDCNGGLCRVTLQGPRCFCPDMPWYLTSGDRCQTHVSKLGLGLGVGLGLGLTVLILLVLCLVLAICLARGKAKLARASDSGEDSGWLGSRSRSHATGIYHVNGRGSAPWKGSTARGAYKPSADAAGLSVPMRPQAEASASL